MKTIWLHSGIPKTGSTAIQNFLCKNKNLLSSLGYEYPTNFSKESKKSLNYGMRNSQQNGNLRDFLIHSAEEPIEKMVNNMNLDKSKDIIFSTEVFYLLASTPKLLESFKTHISTKLPNHKFSVIFYLRRQDELVESLYRQYLKPRNEIDYQFNESFLENSEVKLTFNFQKFIAVFANIFGEENIIVRPFEKGQFKNNNVIEDFVHTLGIDDTSSMNIDISSNEKFSHEITEYVRLAKKFLSNHHLKVSNFFYMINKSIRGDKPIFLVSPNLKKKLVLQYESMNNSITSKYTKKSILFTSPTPQKDDSWQLYSMTTEGSIKVSSLLFVSLLEQVGYINDRLRNIENHI